MSAQEESGDQECFLLMVEEYIMLGEYSAVEPHSRICFTHSWQETSRHEEHIPGLITKVTVELETIGSATK